MRLLRTILIVLVAGIALAACNAGNPPPAESEGDYVSQIQAERAAKDEAFRKQPNEPVPPGKVNDFLPLKYFPPDPDTSCPHR